MGCSASKAKKQEGDGGVVEPLSWEGAETKDLGDFTHRYVKVAFNVFNEFADRPQSLCIIKFDTGEVHRYQPESFHKLKFEDPKETKIEEGTRVIHGKRGPGTIQDITLEPETVIMRPEQLLFALDLLLDHDGKTAKMLRNHQEKLFREADHHGSRTIDFVEFLSFSVRFVIDGVSAVLDAAGATTFAHVKRILQSWNESKLDVKKMTELYAMCFVDLVVGFTDAELEIVDLEDPEMMAARERLERHLDISWKANDEKDDDPSLLGTLTSFTGSVGNAGDLVLRGSLSKLPSPANLSVGKTGAVMFSSLSGAANKIEASAKGVKSGIKSVGQAGLSGDFIGAGKELVPSSTGVLALGASLIDPLAGVMKGSPTRRVTEETVTKVEGKGSKALLKEVAQRDGLFDATKVMLKHASQVYTTRSLLELKFNTPEDLAAAGVVAVPSSESFDTYQWELIFTQLSLEGGIGLVQFVDLCLRLRQEGNVFLRDLEHRQEDKRLQAKEGQRASTQELFPGLSAKGSEFKAKMVQSEKRAINQSMSSELRRRQRAITSSLPGRQSAVFGDLSEYSRKVSSGILSSGKVTSGILPSGLRRSSVTLTETVDGAAMATDVTKD